MKKIFPSSPLILLVLLMAIATADEKRTQSEGRGFFIIGAYDINIDDLNIALGSHGYEKLGSRFYSIGGCGYGIIHRVVVGGEGHGLWGDEIATQGYKVTLTGGYGLFNLGYLVVKEKNFNLYPFVGFGGGALTLNIVEHGAPTFDEMLDNPHRGSQISSGGLIMSLGLGTDYLFNISPNARGEGGMAAGLRIGYNFCPVIGSWIYDETEIHGGPEIGITGPFVKLMIGGGGKNVE